MDDYVLIREKTGGAHVLALFQNTDGAGADNDASNEGEELTSLALSAMTRLTGHSNPEEMLARTEGDDAKELVKMMMTEREEESLAATLEVWLWGPPLPSSLSEPLTQRWLDLERARALNEVLRKGGGLGKVRLTVSEEMRMAFLIGARAGEVSKISTKLNRGEEGMNL